MRLAGNEVPLVRRQVIRMANECAEGRWRPRSEGAKRLLASKKQFSMSVSEESGRCMPRIDEATLAGERNTEDQP